MDASSSEGEAEELEWEDLGRMRRARDTPEAIRDVANGMEKASIRIPWKNEVDDAAIGGQVLRYMTEHCTGGDIRIRKDAAKVQQNCVAASSCYVVPLDDDDGDTPLLGSQNLRSRAPIIECSFASPCSHRCRNRLVQHGLPQCCKGDWGNILNRRVAPFEVFRTKAPIGWSIRARSSGILQGSFLFELIGELITTKTATQRENRFEVARALPPYLMEGRRIKQPRIIPIGRLAPMPINTSSRWREMHLDVGRYANVCHFLKHRLDQTNLVAINVMADGDMPHVAIFAARSIAPWEELTCNLQGSSKPVAMIAD